MAAFSDYLENQIIEDYLRTGTVHLALFTADPTDANTTAGELGDSGYSRQTIAFTAGTASGGGTETENDAQVEFPAIVDGEVTVTHFGVYDAATDGNLLIHGSFTTSRTLQVDDVPSVAAGAITFTVD